MDANSSWSLDSIMNDCKKYEIRCSQTENSSNRASNDVDRTVIVFENEDDSDQIYNSRSNYVKSLKGITMLAGSRCSPDLGTVNGVLLEPAISAQYYQCVSVRTKHHGKDIKRKYINESKCEFSLVVRSHFDLKVSWAFNQHTCETMEKHAPMSNELVESIVSLLELGCVPNEALRRVREKTIDVENIYEDLEKVSEKKILQLTASDIQKLKRRLGISRNTRHTVEGTAIRSIVEESRSLQHCVVFKDVGWVINLNGDVSLNYI